MKLTIIHGFILSLFLVLISFQNPTQAQQIQLGDQFVEKEESEQFAATANVSQTGNFSGNVVLKTNETEPFYVTIVDPDGNYQASQRVTPNQNGEVNLNLKSASNESKSHVVALSFLSSSGEESGNINNLISATNTSDPYGDTVRGEIEFPTYPPPASPTTVPKVHRSDEANVNEPPACTVKIKKEFLVYTIDESVEVRGIRPDGSAAPDIINQWKPVDDVNPAILEGKVVPSPEVYGGPHVSFEDNPIRHYGHDLTFHVRPDPTSDNRYSNLLARQIQPDGRITTQNLIEVEWEAGLGSDKIEGLNPIVDPSIIGNSGGFYTTGHTRSNLIWNWPTVGDHVHVEGQWIWDRGHPPAKTEIHPPRLVAIQRHLPEMINARTSDIPTGEPGRPLLATRIDVFGSGDGSPLYNNRGGPLATGVPMTDRDYSFNVAQLLPKPTPDAQLKYVVVKQNGDTYRGDPEIEIIPRTTTERENEFLGYKPLYAKVTIPWASNLNVDDSTTFARTIFLYWDAGQNTGYGIANWFKGRTIDVELIGVVGLKGQDNLVNGPDNEFRIFAEVGGKWLFFNENALIDIFGTTIPIPDILKDGLGDYNVDERKIVGGDGNGGKRVFTVYVPEGDSFRVHAGGWEADGANLVFGDIVDPSLSCEALGLWLNLHLFKVDVAAAGAQDDPIGEVNKFFVNTKSGIHKLDILPEGPYELVYRNAIGDHTDLADGPLFAEPITGLTDPRGTYSIIYKVTERPWLSLPTQ